MTSSSFPHLTDVSLLRTALDCAPGGLILLEKTPDAEADFRIALFNQAAEKLIGQPEARIVGQRARAVLAHLVPDRLWPVAGEVSASGEAYHEPLWLTLPDRTRRRYDLTLCPHPNGVAVSFQDITAFEQQRTLLEGVIEHSSGGIVVEKALRAPEESGGDVVDFQAVLINPKALEFGQHTREEALSRTIRQLNPHFEPSGLLDAYRSVLTTGKPFRVEFFHEPAQRWLELLASRIDEEMLVVLFHDITDRQRASLEVARQKSLLEGVMDAVTTGINVFEAVRDADGELLDFRVRLANQTSAAYAGVEADALIGKTMTELYPASKTLGMWAEFAETYRTGLPRRREHHYADVDRWFDISVKKLGDGLVVTYSETTDRKRAEQELQRKNDLLEGVMNSSQSAISVWNARRDPEDAGGNIVDFELVMMNERAFATSPLPREHLEKARTLLEIYPSSKTTGTFADRVKVVETGVPFHEEVHYSELDRWYNVSMTKFGDGVVVTFLEITDRKRAELRLQEQARLFDGILAHMQNGLTVLEAVRDPEAPGGEVVDWRYVAVAQTNLDDTGLTRADFLANTMTTLFPSVRQSNYWSVYREVLATGQPRRFETHYHFDGYDNYLDNTVSRLDENRLISVYTLVNEQKKAMQRVEEQAATLRSVLDATAIPVVLFQAIRDENGTIVDYRYLAQNDTNARLVGLPHHEMTGRTMLDILPELKESGIFDRYVAVTETGQSARFELPLPLQSGLIWLDFQVVKHGDGIVVSAIDQTQLRQALHNSERLVEELKRSNADLEQFAYVASHDLQEPLRKITSFGERIDKKYGEALGPDGRLYLERMRDAAARMSLLITNLLTFSRLTRRSDALVPTDLNAIVRNVLNDLEMKIGETGASVSVTPLPTLLAVPGQMQQLFQNLLANALKFTKPGVPPDIRLGAEPLTPAERDAHRLDATRRYVKITLRDNGIGFEPAYAERIFVIFQRLHGRADYEGTGIGLAIVKKIVENHGGTLWAEGQPGAGATFFVVLPV